MSIIKIKNILRVGILAYIVFTYAGCEKLEKSRSNLILEVSVKTSGQVTFQGEKVLLNLYEDGNAEADVLSSRTQEKTQFKRKKFSLPSKDYQEILRLVRLIANTDVKERYLPNAPSSDLYSITTINFKNINNQKIKITMEEYSTGVLLDDYGENYPKPLCDLLKKIFKVREEIK